MTSPPAQASALRRAWRFAEAEQAAREAAALFPDAAGPLIELGRVQSLLSRDEEALASFREAERLAPDDDLPLAWQVAVLDAWRKPSESLATGEAALERFPDSWVIRVALGRTHRRRGDYRTALSLFEHAGRLAPDDPRAASWHLIGLADLWRLDEAEQIAARFPDHPRVLGAWALVLHGANRLPEAVACYDHLLTLVPDDLPAALDRALILPALDRFDEAQAAAEDLVLRFPHVAPPLVLQAMLTGDGDAVALIDRALTIQPPLPWALTSRIDWAEEDEGDLVARLVALRPDNESVRLAEAWFHHRCGRNEEAIASTDRVLALLPDHDQALHARACFLLAEERADEAERFAAEALVRLAPRPLLHLARAKALRALHRADEALVEVESALAASPRFGDAWDDKASLLRSSDPAAALQAVEAWLRLLPGDRAASVSGAFICGDLKRYDEGVAYLDQVLAREPGNEYLARIKLDYLNRAGRFKEARAFGRQARTWATDPDLHAEYAWALARLGKLKKARKVIRKTVKKLPPSCLALGRAHQIKRMAKGRKPGRLLCFC